MFATGGVKSVKPPSRKPRFPFEPSFEIKESLKEKLGSLARHLDAGNSLEPMIPSTIGNSSGELD